MSVRLRRLPWPPEIRMHANAIRKLARTAALAALVPLLPWTAWGNGNPHLHRGMAHLADMEDEKALAAFERALASPRGDHNARAKILLYRGIAEANLLRQQDAASSFRKALEADPTIALPELTSPKIRSLFASVRAQVAVRAPAPPPAASPAMRVPATGPVDDEGQRSWLNNWPAWTALGAGLTAAGTALALGILSNAELDKANDLGLPYERALEHHDRAGSLAVGANVLFGVAAAAAVTSAVVFYLGWRRARHSATAMVSPDGAGVLLWLGGESW